MGKAMTKPSVSGADSAVAPFEGHAAPSADRARNPF